MNNLNEVTLEYQLLKWRLIINNKLYEENVIDINTFNKIEDSILNKMKKIESR